MLVGEQDQHTLLLLSRAVKVEVVLEELLVRLILVAAAVAGIMVEQTELLEVEVVVLL